MTTSRVKYAATISAAERTINGVDTQVWRVRYTFSDTTEAATTVVRDYVSPRIAILDITKWIECGHVPTNGKQV